MKKLTLVLLFIGILAAGAIYNRFKTSHAEEKNNNIAVVKAERGPITMKVSTTGRVVSNLDVEIKCKASGEVITLPFNISDQVKKGDLLLEIDPVDELRNVRQAEVTLSSSEARLAQSQQNLRIAEKNLEIERQRAAANLESAEIKAKDDSTRAKRNEELLVKKLISQEEYDTSVTAKTQSSVALTNAKIQLDNLKVMELELEVKRQEIKLNEAQVEKDKITLAINQQRLKETKVIAPMDGVVSQRKAEVGQIISSGITNIGGGTAVMTLSDLSRMFILASVDESDIGKVKEGQFTQITTDAYAGIHFEGKVITIAVQGVNSSNVVTFEVKIEVLGDNKALLKPEMTTNVEIIAAQKNDALLIPADAVLLKEGKYFITVTDGNGKTEERQVVTGISDYIKTEILEGIKEGEAVEYQLETVIKQENQNSMPPPPPPM